MLSSEFAVVVTLELRILLGSRVWILDGVFDLLASDVERFGDAYPGPFQVVVLTALDVS